MCAQCEVRSANQITPHDHHLQSRLDTAGVNWKKQLGSNFTADVFVISEI